MFCGDIKVQVRSTPDSFVFLGDVTAEFAIPGQGLRQGTVAVKAFMRKGKLVRGFRRKDLLRNAASAARTRSGKSVMRLAKQTLEQGAVPSRRQIAATLGEMGQDLIKNPRKFIRDGKAREKLVREMLQKRGVNVPSKRALIRSAGKSSNQAFKKSASKLKKFATSEDTIVNASGFVASKVGASTGIPGMGLAGDYVGAATARTGLTHSKATRAAARKLKADKAFQEATALQKAGMFKREWNQQMRSMKEMRADNATGDAAGWAVGNAVASALEPVPIPFKGAAAAMPTVPSLVKAGQRIRQGEKAGQVAKEAAEEIGRNWKDILNKPRKWIEDGNRREQQLRDRLNKHLQAVKQLKENG